MLGRLLKRARRGRPSRKSTQATAAGELPLPTIKMRQLVGPTEEQAFDNPTGIPVYAELPIEAYDAVFDFGCGCGRIARQLIQQRSRPSTYLGIDLHRGMVRWCQENLSPHAPEFRFEHHDVYNFGFNPGRRKPRMLPLPASDGSFSLVNAHSVFTHLRQDEAEHYLREAARVLRPDGILRSTWFLFEKVDFPMMQDFQNALFINDLDLSNAVIFERDWVRERARAAGLTLFDALAPAVHGYQWVLLMTPSRQGIEEVELPLDAAAPGIHRPPLMPRDADRIGLGRQETVDG